MKIAVIVAVFVSLVAVPVKAADKPVIAVFFDGTNNNLSDRTNVSRALRLYEQISEVDREVRAHYVEGLGAEGSGFSRPLALATGLGWRRKVAEGFALVGSGRRDLGRNSEVHLYGFSRGAFTARILAGLLADVGPLDAALTHKEWRALGLRLIRAQSCSPPARSCGAAKRRERVKRVLEARNLRPKRTDTAVDYLGLWDTVAAIGAPNLRELSAEMWPAPWPDQICFTRAARHALALDDNRARAFTPQPLLSAHANKECAIALEAVVDEQWFRGAHADVGGGYHPEETEGAPLPASLSDVSLQWVIEGAPLTPNERSALTPEVAASPGAVNAPIHDAERNSLAYRAAFYRKNRTFSEYRLRRPDGTTARLRLHKSVSKRSQHVAPSSNYYDGTDYQGPRRPESTEGAEPVCVEREGAKVEFVKACFEPAD